MLVPALALSAVSVAAVGRIETTPLLFYVLMALIGASVAAGSTAAGGLLADSVPRSGSGAAVGMNQMAGDLGYLTAPSALGYVAQGSFQLAYLLGAAPAALVLLVALRLPGRRAQGKSGAVRAAEPEPAEPVA